MIFALLKMRDNLAGRVRESYKLDDRRFQEIADILYHKIGEAKKNSEAGDGSNPAIILNLGNGEILVRAEYHVGDESRTVLFGYVGRLIAGSRIGRGKTAPLYLQTFDPPDHHLGAIPHPNLVEVLREYIN